MEPLLFPIPAPVPVREQDLISTFFQQQKFVQKLAFSMLNAALFPESWPLIFYLTLVLPTFYVRSGTGMHHGSGSAKAKSYGSGATTTLSVTSCHYPLRFGARVPESDAAIAVAEEVGGRKIRSQHQQALPDEFLTK